MKPGRLLWVATGIFLWLACTAWLRPLHLPDEARYVGVAWEMLRSGNWLTPMLNGAPFFHKPPLFYWITGASISLLGMNEWSARMTPLFAATACALALFMFVRRWVNPKLGTQTLLVLLVQPLFFIAAQFANLDMLVASCITVTILLAAHVALQLAQGHMDRPALALAYASAALGVLAKGLIGAVLPGVVIVAWLLLGRRVRILFRLIWLPGLALFFGITAPWFLLEQQQFPEFLHYFFVVQHFKRFAAEGFNNVQPWYFYVALLLLVNATGLFWLLRSALRRPAEQPETSNIRQLMWVWLVLITLFFSLPQSKPLGYILPVLAPLAFLTANGYHALGQSYGVARWTWWAGLGLSAIVSLGSVGYFSMNPQRSSRDLSLVLQQQVRAGDQVVMLHRFSYDVPFYARLPDPVVVVEDWRDPEIEANDSWPKELLHAVSFAKPEPATPMLIAPEQLTQRLCRSGVTWLVGNPREPERYDWLNATPRVYSDNYTALWKWERPTALEPAGRACSASARGGTP